MVHFQPIACFGYEIVKEIISVIQTIQIKNLCFQNIGNYSNKQETKNLEQYALLLWVLEFVLVTEKIDHSPISLGLFHRVNAALLLWEVGVVKVEL